MNYKHLIQGRLARLESFTESLAQEQAVLNSKTGGTINQNVLMTQTFNDESKEDPFFSLSKVEDSLHTTTH